MNNVIAGNKEEIEKYREKLFKAKEKYHREQIKLPFEKKMEILVKLNKIVKDSKKHAKIIKI